MQSASSPNVAAADNQATDDYFGCGLRYGRASAKSGEDPFNIAIAAKSACGRERNNAVSAIRARYRAAVWPSVVSVTDKLFVDGVIERVITDRTS
jgi:hypothetical protein